MPRAPEDVSYYREMGCVVSRTLTRLMEHVLKERPKTSKEVLDVVGSVVRENLGGLAGGEGWLCKGCAQLNTGGVPVCGSCRASKDDPVPAEQVGDGPLLMALRYELEQRAKAISDREKELGITPSTAPKPRDGAKAARETPSRFGDGMDLLASQEVVPEKPILLPPGYAPPESASSPDGKDVLRYLAAWEDTQGNRMWGDDTITDFCQDADFLASNADGEKEAMIIRALYAYTHSQLGPRFFWAVWIPAGGKTPTPGKWEPLFKTSEDLEIIYTKGTLTHTSDTEELRKMLSVPKGESKPIKAEPLLTLRKVGLDAWSLPDGVCLVRYENKLRECRTSSPLRDTVAYLPPGDRLGPELLHDEVEESVLPLSGILEYIAASTPDKCLGAYQKWTCLPFDDNEVNDLIRRCVEQTNQQRADKDLHEEALRLTERTEVRCQANFPRIPPALFAEVFKRSCGHRDGELLTPEEIARAFTMQCLSWHGKHFLLALSTTTVETRTPHILGHVEEGKVVPVFRVVANFWPQQIFYLLNLSMREAQFGNHDAMLTVNGTGNGTAGRYYAAQPNGWEGVEGWVRPDEVKFHRKDKGLFGTACQVCVTWGDETWQVVFPSGKTERVDGAKAWVSLRSWMMPQVRPLIYFTNQALDAVQGSKGGVRKTYRGIRCSVPHDMYATGRVLVWAQYSSSSNDQGVAAAFAKGESPAAVFTIRGRTCAVVQPYSRFAREAEMLYRNNTCFRVVEALTKEQAQILGKENLQLFTLEEVTEVEMHCVLVRKQLPHARTTAAASVVFQAEAALRGSKCLELSIESVTDGEAPARWQMFLKTASFGCPIKGSTAWTGTAVDTEKLRIVRDAFTSLEAVGEGATPQHALYLADAPDGRSGTAGLLSAEVGGDGVPPRMRGTYTKGGEGFTMRNSKITYDGGVYVLSDGYSKFESGSLLGEWPSQGPVVTPAEVKKEVNILEPRCRGWHLMTQPAVIKKEYRCTRCRKKIDTKVEKFVTCDPCRATYHTDCLLCLLTGNVVLKVENNTLVRYIDGVVDCPQITKLTLAGRVLVDQHGTKMRHTDTNQLTRLCARTFVVHNLPLVDEASEPSTELIPIIRELVQNDQVNIVRLFGREGNSDNIKMKIGVQGEGGWCIDLELRQTAARPGLAAGLDGAMMASRIVALGVPLEVVGLRNNNVGLEGAKILLEAIRGNPSVIEATVGDDGDAGGDMEVVGKALSVRCMYNRCKIRGEELLDDHLSGAGGRWPDVFHLALHDVEGLALPVSMILEQHPEGWNRMCELFAPQPGPRPTKESLHNACKHGRLKAVRAILDDCKMDPDTKDGAGVSALLVAVQQPAFESEEGRALVGRLVTEETKQESRVLRSAVNVCGPQVTGELLRRGAATGDLEEVLSLAAENELFETRADVLQLLISKASGEEKSAALAAVVKGCGSATVMDELLKAEADSSKALQQSMSKAPELVSYLLEHHARLPGEGDLQDELMRAACANKKFNSEEGVRVLKRLFKDGPFKDVEALCTACEMGHPLLANYLLENGTATDGALLLCCESQFDWGSSAEGRKTLDAVAKDTLESRDTKGMTPLAHAVCKGQVLTTEYLVDKGADLKTTCDGGRSVAHYLAESPEFESTAKGAEVARRVITKEGINDDAGGICGTPLTRAVEKRRFKLCRVLLDEGADPGVGPTLLIASGTDFGSDLRLFEQLIAEGDVNKPVEGFTPLTSAVSTGNLKAIAVLVKHGAEGDLRAIFQNPAFCTPEGLDAVRSVFTSSNVNTLIDDEAPLYSAVTGGLSSIASCLLDAGASPDVCGLLTKACCSKEFCTPAGRKVFVRLVTAENVNEGNGEPLRIAARTARFEVMGDLLDRGADVMRVEENSYEKQHLLHETLGNPRWDTEEGARLLKRVFAMCGGKVGELMSCENCMGTPFLCAVAQTMKFTLLDTMLAAAPLEVLSFGMKKGATILHYLATFSGEGCIAALKKVAVFPSMLELQDSNGDTALHHACRHQRLQAITTLLDCGANIKAVNEKKETPLHKAVGCQKFPSILCIETLLQHGADPNARDEDGDTPLQMLWAARLTGAFTDEATEVLRKVTTVQLSGVVHPASFLYTAKYPA